MIVQALNEQAKTIVIVDNDAHVTGGTAQVAISSAIELAKLGKRIVYVSADKAAIPELQNSGAEIYCLNYYNINTDPNRIRAAVNGIWNRRVAGDLRRILQGLNPAETVVHVHGYMHALSPSIFKVCRKMHFHTVLTLHDYFILCPCGGFYDYSANKICTRVPLSWSCITCNCDKRSYLQKIWRMLRQIGAIRYVRDNRDLNLIYISDFSFSKIEAWIKNKHKMFYVRNPYDLGKEQLFTAENNRNYLYVGRLSKEKGADLFCSVLSKLKREGKISGEAVVIGDGDQREALEKSYPDIRFLGWKEHDEMLGYMKDARALIFPSRWYETAGLTPIEFMSHGIPCIISDCCAAADYVKGQNGLLFEGENAADLEHKILIAEEDEQWSVIAQKLRETFQRNDYSSERHARVLCEAYEEIIKEEL